MPPKKASAKYSMSMVPLSPLRSVPMPLIINSEKDSASFFVFPLLTRFTPIEVLGGFLHFLCLEKIFCNVHDSTYYGKSSCLLCLATFWLLNVFVCN